MPYKKKLVNVKFSDHHNDTVATFWTIPNAHKVNTFNRRFNISTNTIYKKM